MVAPLDANEPAGGSVALLPEPFEVDREAVSRAAKAARDALVQMSARRLRRPPRPAPAPAAEPPGDDERPAERR